MNIDDAFKAYHRPLIFYANSIIDNFEAAEDIVTEVFIKAWQREFNDEKHFKNALFTWVKNSCIDYGRGRNNKAKLSKGYKGDTVFDPYHCLIIADFVEPLRLAVLQLPHQCRAVVQLYLKGIPLPEICKRLSMSNKTVHSHKTRAIHLLRKLIKLHEKEDS